MLNLQEAYLSIYNEDKAYDILLDYLLENGFVDDEASARNIMNVMSEEWRDEILQEYDFKKTPPRTLEKIKTALGTLAAQQEKIRGEMNPKAETEKPKRRTTDLRKIQIR